MSQGGAATEPLPAMSLFNDLGWKAPLKLNIDAEAARAIASRHGVGRIRHLEVRFLWLQRGQIARSGTLVCRSLAANESCCRVDQTDDRTGDERRCWSESGIPRLLECCISDAFPRARPRGGVRQRPHIVVCCVCCVCCACLLCVLCCVLCVCFGRIPTPLSRA